MKDVIQHDAETGLADRSNVWSMIDDSLNMVRRNKGSSGVLLIKINNTSGIKVLIGDEGYLQYIKLMATRINNCLWDLDTAARFDEDQFVIIANSILKLEDIHVVMRKVHEYMAIDCEINGQNISPSSSIGIVLIPMDGIESDEIMSNAQIALNSAKPKGENSYAYFNKEIGIKIEEQEAIKNSILSTLADESFVLMVQPKIDIKTDKICGVEALVRMRDSEGNIVSPDEFIPVAENSNLILKIGEWVLHKAQDLSKAWAADGINLPISVNISEVQFKKSAALLSTLHKMLEDGDYSPENIVLEIDENTITNNIQLSAAILTEIKSYGYQISIDGFGVGFSSLSVLRDLKVDEIKIDRHFINDVPEDAKSTAILQSIIMLGKSMEFRVVCMGVESNEQLAVLNEHGCDEFQGFLISKPINANGFVEWYKNYKN